MIETKVHLRDPFVLLENGTYYLYGTGSGVWDCYKNDSGTLAGEWKRVEPLVYEKPPFAEKCMWAPEVHKYKGAFYMIATYFSSETQHRGCTILRATSPEGPFTEITDGHITPHHWDAIDGTLYVDGNGQPWMVFVHEWTCTDDGIGRMAVMKLSEDLSHAISEPVELFRADAPSWTNKRVTDGCFLYTTAEGRLLMLWSNFWKDGYCVGLAHSENGLVDGKWIQQDTLLFSKQTIGTYDGGHGMIFTDTDGQKYLSIHSPNSAKDGRVEEVIFLPVAEQDGSLICIVE